MAVNRRGTRKVPLAERLAAEVPKYLLDLRPYLDRGQPGLAEWCGELVFHLQVQGVPASDMDRVRSEVMQALGVDIAACFRRMLGYPSGME